MRWRAAARYEACRTAPPGQAESLPLHVHEPSQQRLQQLRNPLVEQHGARCGARTNTCASLKLHEGEAAERRARAQLAVNTPCQPHSVLMCDGV